MHRVFRFGKAEHDEVAIIAAPRVRELAADGAGAALKVSSLF